MVRQRIVVDRDASVILRDTIINGRGHAVCVQCDQLVHAPGVDGRPGGVQYYWGCRSLQQPKTGVRRVQAQNRFALTSRCV